ncbi:glycosyltransferase [Streptomyces sp. M19]
MPRFSVIVPAYKVQAYLQECLRSVLGQDHGDIELIVVDDGSPDGCGAIIDEAAARDPRVVPVRPAAHTGPGGARDAGLDRARGDYLVFLDGDDTSRRRAARDGPAAGGVRRAGPAGVRPRAHVLDGRPGARRPRRRARPDRRPGGPAHLPLAHHPELLRQPSAVWNKTYRRDFVERQGLRFPPGFYEDVPWTYPALLAAGSIGVLDRVCVHYRQRRRGGILRTPSSRHLDVFDQWDRVSGTSTRGRSWRTGGPRCSSGCSTT